MVVETWRACSSGNVPSETTQPAKAPAIATNATATAAARRTTRRLPQAPSCPGLSRASTPFAAAGQEVEGRDKPGHDDRESGGPATSLLPLIAPLIPSS